MHVGELVAQRFRLDAAVASGGMGTVFFATDLVNARSVAVKTCIFPSAIGGESSRPRVQTRFEHEAQALAEIADDSVVAYVAHGVSAAGEPFLVMDWVEGESLAQRLAREGLSLEETLALGRDLARALGVIHAQGIVHRDLKPANVMLRGGDVRRAVLVDFGVARRAEAVSVTLSGARVGTLLYMAPEQIRDPRRVDGRADVFGLGCVLFECLTGVRAFDADDALATIAHILLDDAPDLHEHRAELPEEVAVFVRRLLAREREARPASGPDLERQLEHLRARYATLGLGPPSPLASASTDSQRLGAAARATLETASREVLENPREPEPEPPSAPPSEARRRSVPLRSNRFVGRDAELEHLQALIHSGADLLILWGPAGIGKTRLVQELWQRGGPGKLALVEFVDLSQSRDLDDAVRVVTRRIAASVRGNERPEQVLGRALGRLGECVFVLDRVEHLGRELGALIDPWRRAAPGVCFLLTSRERLRFDGAVAVELGPLPVRLPAEASTGLDQLSPAGRLFFERAREADPGFAPGPALARAVEAAAAALEGVPLAIELAAARVRLLGLEGVVARLSKQLELLGRPDPNEAEGQATMRAAISASVDLLTEEERRAFVQCAVFRGGFTAAAAEAVLQPESDALCVLDLLQSLRDKSLLASPVDQGRTEEPRLFLFSVVRQYALAELARSGDEARIRARHGAYFTARAVEAGRRARAGGDAAALSIEKDSDDLIAAVDYALERHHRDVALALDALVALEPVISTRGPLPSFMNLIDRAIAAAEGASAEAASSSERASTLCRLRLMRARIAATSGRFDSALSDLGHVLAEAQARSDHALEASAELERGVVQHLRRALEPARRAYERALELLRGNADPEVEARCYGNLGALLHDSGRFTEAAAYYWRAIRLLEDSGELRMRGNFLNNLGVLEQELGSLGRARQHYEQALRLVGDAGDARLRGITLGNLGVLEQEASDWERARRCHEQALALFEPLDDAHSEALCLSRLGATLAMLGSCAEAEWALNRAHRLLRAGESSRVEAVRLQRAFLDLSLARAALAENQPEEARARLDQANERCLRVEQPFEGEPSLASRSDDIRVTLRILKPMIAALTRAFE
jgi:serine/threonine protein kinase/tetratricopeptide (TPR) repeat protein